MAEPVQINKQLVREAIRVRCLSVGEVCERAGVSRETFYTFMAGRSKGSTIKAICKALGLRRSDVILGGVDGGK